MPLPAGVALSCPGLPRWINVVGAVAAAAFGGIFLLQGVCDVTGSESLRYVAFDLLGHHVERLLPDVVYFWFVALLLLASWGMSCRLIRRTSMRSGGRHVGQPAVRCSDADREGPNSAAIRLASLRERGELPLDGGFPVGISSWLPPPTPSPSGRPDEE